MAIQHRIFVERNNKGIKKRKKKRLLSSVYLQIPLRTSRKIKKVTLSNYTARLQKKLTKATVKNQPKVKLHTKAYKAYKGKTPAGQKFKTKHFAYKEKKSNKLRFLRLSTKRSKSLSFLKRALPVVSTRRKFAVWVRFANKVQKVRRYRDRKRIARLLCKKTYFRKKLPKKFKKLYFSAGGLSKKRQVFRVRRRTILNVSRIKKPVDRLDKAILTLKLKVLAEYTSAGGDQWYNKERNALLGRIIAAAPIKSPVTAAPIKSPVTAAPIKPAVFKAWIEPAVWKKMSPAARRSHLAKKEEYKSLRLEFFKKQNAISAKKV